MNWNNDKSIKLSKFCIYVFSITTIFVCIFAPYIFTALIELRANDLNGKLIPFLVSTYSCAVPAALALYHLYRLIDNIDNQKTFTENNVKHLRVLSWLCILAGTICLLSSLYYMPFLMLAIAAAFVGLILRIVKNVFAQAVIIKMENDYTI